MLFSLLSPCILLATLDEDNDGMSDVWQKEYNIVTGDTTSDPDTDGYTNLQEAQVGIDPHNVYDYFRMLNYSISPDIISWRSLEDRSYDIEESRDLVSWNKMDDLRGTQGLQTSHTLTIPVTPLNDNFESRYPTPTDAIQTTGSNVNATVQASESDDPRVSGDKSVWWTWKATVAGEVTITTDGSDFDTTLAIYSGNSLASLVLIDSDDDDGEGSRSSITFTADPSLVYSIRVNGYSTNARSGNIILNHPFSAGTFDPPVKAEEKPNKMFFRVKGDPSSDLDTDSDRLVTWEERLLGTDPTKPDTDGDGMSDSFEFIHGFDPSPSGAGDGALDSDGDGVINAHEETLANDPRNPDSNGNGINDGNEDFDSDGLTNAAELNVHNTDPINPDSDGDQMPDGWEVEYGLDPNDDSGEDGQEGDPDEDGVSNFDEYLNGTDPKLEDTDGDGIGDNIEIEQGSDPANPDDEGNPPEQGVEEVLFVVGDDSGSHSENWLMKIVGIGDDPDTRVLKVKGAEFGVLSDPTPVKLLVGKSYEIVLLHCGSNRSEGPDYDWDAFIGGKPNSPVKAPTEETAVFIHKETNASWIVDNRSGLLGRNDGGAIEDTNLAEGRKAYLLPVLLVQGELASESEDAGNWLMTEAEARPVVEMEVTEAVVSGTDINVTVQGTVADHLSKYGINFDEIVHTLEFIVEDEVLHSINVTSGIENGFAFNETITVSNAKPGGYVLKALTSQNALGHKGWDKVALGLNFSPSPDSFPSDGADFRIEFTQNPTNGQIDTAKVFFGDRAAQAGDLVVTETAADSFQFEGQIKVIIDDEEQTVPCSLSVHGDPVSFAAGSIDEIVARVSYTLPTLGKNILRGVWKETAINSLSFASSGYQTGNEILKINAMNNLTGSTEEEFEEITIRIGALTDLADLGTFKIKVGQNEYPLKKFTFGGEEFFYPYDEAYPNEPKHFLPSSKIVPQKLRIPGYNSGNDSFDFKIKLDEREIGIKTVRIQRGFRDDYFNPDNPLAAQKAPTPQQRAAASEGWKEPGDTVTMTDLLTAYEWIYGGDEKAMILLRVFQENDNIILLEDELGDLDVNYLRNLKVEIIIEDDDDDVNPIVCANLLYAGLHQALAYPEFRNKGDIVDNLELFVTSRKVYAKKAAEIGAAGAEMYLAGITMINEPLDWIMIIGEVSDGQYGALAGALPFVSARQFQLGKRMLFRTPGGKVLGEITDAAQYDAILRSQRKRVVDDRIAILEEAGLDDDTISLLIRSGTVQHSKSRGVLRNRMIKAGRQRPTSNHQAHHDFPWEFKEWFAAHKIDVNSPQYGRWAHIDDHTIWHNGDPKFNDVWEDFIYDVNGNQVKRTKEEILEKFDEIQATYTNT